MSARTTVPGLLVVAKAAARAGADVLARRWTGHRPAVPLGTEEIGAQTKSSGSDWVTDYDRRAEQAVREVVAGYRPSDEITGEEYGATRPAEPSGYRWSIDPLDGTTNFIRNIPFYATSVAAADDGGAWLAGVVHAPALGRIYYAAAGQGAWLETAGSRSRLTGPDPERKGRLLGTGFSYDAARRREQYAALPSLAAGSADTRRLGAAALDLCLVADGTLDDYLEQGLNEYDYAAGALIAEEAGVVVHRPGAPGGVMSAG